MVGSNIFLSRPPWISSAALARNGTSLPGDISLAPPLTAAMCGTLSLLLLSA